MKDPKSKCCNADMTVHEADEGTNFYVCVKCQKPTDSRPEIIVTACTCASFFTVRGKHKPDCPKQMNKKKNHKTCKKENCNRAPYILSGEFCERHCIVCAYCQYEPENGHSLTCEHYIAILLTRYATKIKNVVGDGKSNFVSRRKWLWITKIWQQAKK